MRPVHTATRSSATPEAIAAFVAGTFTHFDSAFAECGETDILRIAGRRVDIRYAAPELRARFWPTLRHLEAHPNGHPDPADLTICCWDASATTAAIPTPPWRPVDFVKGSRIRGHIVGPLIATYDADGRLFQMHDRIHSRAILHVGSAGELPDWHDRSPFRAFISLWADDRQLALLHGATVAGNGNAVVLAGASGAGKSTTAMACLAAGLEFLGDDACLVDMPNRTVHSLYGRAKLEPAARESFAGLHSITGEHIDSQGGRVLVPQRVQTHAHLQAVLLTAIGHSGETTMTDRLPAAEAAAALAETLRVENGGLRPAAVAALQRLADQVPVRRLVLGADRDRLVACIREAIG